MSASSTLPQPSSSDKTQYGTIRRWQEDRGFGFIEDERGKSIFFHISEFQQLGRPQVGLQVKFIESKDDKGRWQAKRVSPISARFKGKNSHVTSALKANKNNKHSANKDEDRGKGKRRSTKRRRQQNFADTQRRQLFLGLGVYMVLAIAAASNSLSWQIVGWYVLIGLVTFLVYYKDKSAAKQGKWRTPESTLHLLSLMGGWVGAMLAQTYLRHKSQKVDFRILFYITAVINLAILVAWLFLTNNTL